MFLVNGLFVQPPISPPSNRMSNRSTELETSFSDDLDLHGHASNERSSTSTTSLRNADNGSVSSALPEK